MPSVQTWTMQNAFSMPFGNVPSGSNIEYPTRRIEILSRLLEVDKPIRRFRIRKCLWKISQDSYLIGTRVYGRIRSVLNVIPNIKLPHKTSDSFSIICYFVIVMDTHNKISVKS